MIGVSKIKQLKIFYDYIKRKPIQDLQFTAQKKESTTSVGKAQLNFSAPLNLIQQCNSLKPKVLALYANPKYQDNPPLLINKEINELFITGLRLHVMIDAMTTVSSLQDNINTIKPEIILYSGHIISFPFELPHLLLHNENNLITGSLYVITDFIDVLNSNTNLKLVILLTCYSYKIKEYLNNNEKNLNCCFITIEELAHDSAMLSFLKGCSSEISNIYSQNEDIGNKIEQIFIAGIEQFKLDKYNIGNPNPENYGYGKNSDLKIEDRVLIQKDDPNFPDEEGTIKSVVTNNEKNYYNVIKQNGSIEKVEFNNIALALHGTPQLIKYQEGTWTNINID